MGLHNTVYPEPESLDILLRILLSVCESEAVSAITSIYVYLDDIVIKSPETEVTNYDNPDYKLQTGDKAQQNKILNLSIEKEDVALNRLDNQNRTSIFTTKYYFIESGLEGVRKAVDCLNWIYNNKRKNLPEYLKDVDLTNFSFSVTVIWKMYEEDSKYPDGTFADLGGEADSITAVYNHPSVSTPFYFWFSNDYYIKVYSDERYLKHLDIVQAVLDGIYPGKYEADPCDRDDLTNIGYLKREAGRHKVPSREESFKLEEKLIALESEKGKKRRRAIEKRIDELKKIKSNPRCNLD